MKLIFLWLWSLLQLVYFIPLSFTISSLSLLNNSFGVFISLNLFCLFHHYYEVIRNSFIFIKHKLLILILHFALQSCPSLLSAYDFSDFVLKETIFEPKINDEKFMYGEIKKSCNLKITKKKNNQSNPAMPNSSFVFLIILNKYS